MAAVAPGARGGAAGAARTVPGGARPWARRSPSWARSSRRDRICCRRSLLEELETLQERVTPLAEAEGVAAMERELGVPWEDVFASIDRTRWRRGRSRRSTGRRWRGASGWSSRSQRRNAERDILQDLGLLEMFRLGRPAPGFRGRSICRRWSHCSARCGASWTSGGGREPQEDARGAGAVPAAGGAGGVRGVLDAAVAGDGGGPGRSGGDAPGAPAGGGACSPGGLHSQGWRRGSSTPTAPRKHEAVERKIYLIDLGMVGELFPRCASS